MGGLSNPPAIVTPESLISDSAENFDALPDAAGHAGETWLVMSAQGVWPLTLKRKGLYHSNGTDWEKLGVLPIPLQSAIRSEPAGAGKVVSNVFVAENGKLQVEYTE